LGIDVGVAWGNRWHCATSLEGCGVARTDPASFLDFPFEVGQFSQQDSGLKGVEPAVHAEEGVVVAFEGAVRARRRRRSIPGAWPGRS